MRRLLLRLVMVLAFAGPHAVSPATAQSGELSDSNQQKAVLVTGASSGIGRQIAASLADAGFFVYAGARSQQDILSLSQQHNMLGIRLDVTSNSDISSAVELVRQQGRGLYGLVNNAGVFLFDPLIEVSEQDMQFIMDVNVFGPYRVTRAFAPLIIESQGRVANIGSVAGLFAGGLFGPYAMGKHAMEAFTESLNAELSKFDVAVAIVEPGNFRSDIMKNRQRRLDQLSSGERSSLFADEIAGMAGFAQEDRSQHADPKPVADAVLDIMASPEPRLRYLVTPNQREADFTIRKSLQKALQLNQGHRFSLTRDQLIEVLDGLLSAPQ